MNKTIWKITAILLLSLLLVAGHVSAEEETANLQKVVRAIDYSVAATDNGFLITVSGLPLNEVSRIRWNDNDITSVMLSAITSGIVKVRETEDGFEVSIESELDMVGLSEHGTLSISLESNMTISIPISLEVISSGIISSMSRNVSGRSCPWLNFGSPTTVAKNGNCDYGSKNCKKTGWQHTGIDYSGTGKAVAAADGTVVRTEKMSSSDHGMGNNVIVKHTLSDCSTIYTTYSHLESIDAGISVNKSVKKGQNIGTIGGSGYGATNYWSKHLHFEMKTAAVTGNPNGVGRKNSTCQNDPSNAAGSTCWGYVKSNPDNYGYRNPNNYLGR